MTEFLQTLNENAGTLLAILTALYVYYTRRILFIYYQTLKELKEQNWQANRAYVVPRLTFQQKMLSVLEIANPGRTPARNVD